MPDHHLDHDVSQWQIQYQKILDLPDFSSIVMVSKVSLAVGCGQNNYGLDSVVFDECIVPVD